MELKNIENALNYLKPKICKKRIAIKELTFSSKNGEVEGLYRTPEGGFMWPGKMSSLYVQGQYEVPEDFSGSPVYLTLNSLNTAPFFSGPSLPEGMIYIDDQLYHGLDQFHGEVLLSGDKAKGKHNFRAKLWDWENRDYIGVRCMELQSIDAELQAFVYDVSIAIENLKSIGTEFNSKQLENIDAALRLVRAEEQPSSDTVKQAREILSNTIYTGPQTSGPSETFFGNSHIDIAWLWTLAVTHDKCLHTFATVLKLMDEYPDYMFLQSQPQLYEYVKEDDPILYNKIKERVKDGRWDAEGAMWVESDINIPSGESLARQLLYGKRFLKNELGVDSKVAWLPDIFGFSAALPQILKKAGVDYFVTSKLSWNKYNKYPHDTFTWRGIDGSEVMSFFITTPNLQFNTASYAGFVTIPEVVETWNRYEDKRINDETIFVYGHGDGGGGPTREMLENLSRFSKLPNLPTCSSGTLLPFLERVKERIDRFSDVPVWDGELYFELHRGTYTSQAWIKRANRKTEIGLYNAELLAALAHVNGCKYPQAELDIAWKLLLLNQFHDVLPGSSIGEVYKECREQFEQINDTVDKIINSGLDSLMEKESINGKAVVVWNQLQWERNELIELPFKDTDLIGADGKPVLSQELENGTLFSVKAPSIGFAAYNVKPKQSKNAQVGCKVSEDGRKMENDFFCIKLDNNGEISSIIDKKANREVLSAPGNKISAFKDEPYVTNNDAWDIDISYEEYPIELSSQGSIKVVEAGPLRACVEIQRDILSSKLKQRIYIYSDIPRIDFSTNVDWHEQHVLLKAFFPLDIRSDVATYEIQYGAIKRPTHRNTSWDMAKFEVPAHKWADISEQGYGVSLLNDCKYGYSAHNNVLSITLIKSATLPDPKADQGEHEFTYSIYPHTGDWRNDTVKQAYNLNYPVLVRTLDGEGEAEAKEKSYLQIDTEGFVISAIKKAEDSDDLIVRGYESKGGRENVAIHINSAIDGVSEASLLEEVESKVDMTDNGWKTLVKPYEIKTFVLNRNKTK